MLARLSNHALCCAAIILLGVAPPSHGQDTPLLSGGAGFLTDTTKGNTSYLPLLEPLAAVPVGERVVIESRAALGETFSHDPGNPGVKHNHFANLTYLQADIIAQRHLTLVLGDYLIPFNTYNERLSPVWINNLQDGPLVASLGLLNSGSGLGAQVRGNLIKAQNFLVDYAAFFSTRSSSEQFRATRAGGGRLSVYVPERRLELGLSYDRSLQGLQPAHENFYGAHLWWEPRDTGLRFRSEYARGHHAHGYWVEADFRSAAFGGLDSWVGRLEPVFRMQQTFRRDTIVSDGLPFQNVQRADFGLDYNLPHTVRILTSYSRQFSSAGNDNIWETGIVYRYLFPAWKGK